MNIEVGNSPLNFSTLSNCYVIPRGYVATADVATLRFYCVKDYVFYCKDFQILIVTFRFYHSAFYRLLKSQFYGKRYTLMMSRRSKHVSKRIRCWFYFRPNSKCLPQCFFLVDIMVGLLGLNFSKIGKIVTPETFFVIF